MDALPVEVRSACEAAVAKGIAALPGSKQEIVFNGQRFASAREMPPAEKKLYDDAMRLVNDRAIVGGNVPVLGNRRLTPNQVLLVASFGAILVLGLVLRLFL